MADENGNKTVKDTLGTRASELTKARSRLHKALQSNDQSGIKRNLDAANKAQERYLEKLKAERERFAQLENM